MRPRVDSYLDDLDRQLQDIPRVQRMELLEDVRAHVEDALDEISNPSDADILNVLDRMGTPSELAAEQRARLGIMPHQADNAGALRAVLDISAIVFTFFFWPLGIILLWSSPSWDGKAKLIGTLAPPGGFLGALLYYSTFYFQETGCQQGSGVNQPCNSSTAELLGLIGVVFTVATVLMPFATAIYLSAKLAHARRLARS